jgi:hypothetical protein
MKQAICVFLPRFIFDSIAERRILFVPQPVSGDPKGFAKSQELGTSASNSLRFLTLNPLSLFFRKGLTGMLPASPAFSGGVEGSCLKKGTFLTGEPSPLRREGANGAHKSLFMISSFLKRLKNRTMGSSPLPIVFKQAR